MNPSGWLMIKPARECTLVPKRLRPCPQSVVAELKFGFSGRFETRVLLLHFRTNSFLPSASLDCSSPMKKNTSLSKCFNCNRLFTPDARSRDRQRFCGARVCQRARKARNQRLRRKRRLNESGEGIEMKPTEAICVADWMSQNVGLVGLIATIAGEQEPDAVERVVRKVLERGIRITKRMGVINSKQKS